MMYTVYFAVCMFTALSHTPNKEQCIIAAKPVSFPTYNQCETRLEQVRLRYSTRNGQDALFKETPLPHMKGGTLFHISECRIKVSEGYLQCVDCES